MVSVPSSGSTKGARIKSSEIAKIAKLIKQGGYKKHFTPLREQNESPHISTARERMNNLQVSNSMNRLGDQRRGINIQVPRPISGQKKRALS